jgi:predicted amidohydrolase
VDNRLLVGILHLDIRHGVPEENRASLLAYAEEAAEQGAKIIMAPELALSGYGFQSMNEIIPCSEGLTGETVAALSHLAHRYGVYVGTGIAECDGKTGIFYNSSVVLGPEGNIVAHHRKHVAERRWSCPGQPSGTSLFDTPWGKVGLLICADTYYGLLPRGHALHGADLMIVSANWPPVGLDPREVWRARALENGVGFIAANRTGLDRSMDCRDAHSYAVAPDGRVLLDETNANSCVFYVEYPLEGRRFPSCLRRHITAERRPRDYNAIALDASWLDDFPSAWGLPASGTVNIQCLIPPPPSDVASFKAFVLDKLQGQGTQEEDRLLVLPCVERYLPIEEVVLFTKDTNIAVVTETYCNGGPSVPVLIVEGRITYMASDSDSLVADFASARIALVRSSALLHPETAVALSKRGCDIIVSQVKVLDRDLRLLLGIKCLERAVIVVAGHDGATICVPPEGHERWHETMLQEPGSCTVSVNTALTRKKRFLDRVDLEALLRR